MPDKSAQDSAWWARGLLFENCNCQAVCPGHVHFDQLCTHDECVGYWAVVFQDGDFGGTSLAGARSVIAYRSPQHMIDGNWTQVILIDEGTSLEQRQAIEAILTGAAGGPWAVLGRFVSTRLDTRIVPISVEDRGRTKRVAISGLLDSTIEAIRGRERDQPVKFENMFNQIHAPSQVIAKGATTYDDGVITVNTEQTHALYSDFHWSVSSSS